MSAKTGRAGYSPVCGNEWVRGVCEKPRIKCSDCPHQCWLPVTDEVVRWHLSGSDDRGRECVMGVYPMLLDERCFFLAVDFDGEKWEDDALACIETCERLKVPATLERSRSGTGGHVWIFFAEAIPAASLPATAMSWSMSAIISPRAASSSSRAALERLRAIPEGEGLDAAMLARMFERRCARYEAVGYTWKSISSANPPTSSSKSTARYTWPRPKPTAATAAKTRSCKNTTISSCASSPKTSANTSTPFSTPSCAPSPPALGPDGLSRSGGAEAPKVLQKLVTTEQMTMKRIMFANHVSAHLGRLLSLAEQG